MKYAEVFLLLVSSNLSPSLLLLLLFYSRMKMRRHRVFLLCTVGLCVISFLHYYKTLHYVSLLRELSAPYPNIKSFIMVTGFFWREKGLAATPLSPASPEGAPPDFDPFDAKGGLGPRDLGINGVVISEVGRGNGPREEPAPPRPWEKPKENERDEVQRTVSVTKV